MGITKEEILAGKFLSIWTAIVDHQESFGEDIRSIKHKMGVINHRLSELEFKQQIIKTHVEGLRRREK